MLTTTCRSRSKRATWRPIMLLIAPRFVIPLQDRFDILHLLDRETRLAVE